MIKEEFNNSPNSYKGESNRSNSATSKKTFKMRPQTPLINLFSPNSSVSTNENNEIHIRTIKRKNEPENIIKNFSTFMKNIIETKNENFLSGDIKVIDYIISKYLNISTKEIKALQKLAIKINTDFGLLNQFGDYLPNLIELKLNMSVIPSISDIGTSFKNLKNLHICNCNLKELSGIIKFKYI
jgi:hypothetical protein